jgi:glyoxylase-like metal-dependent hydrolase (beta-lactamase superfamily II)
MIDSGARFSIGSVDFAVVNDGSHFYDAGAIFGVVPRVMWERQTPVMDDRYRMETGLNCLLLRSQGKTVLIETGVGGKPGDRENSGTPASEGTLMTSLDSLGVTPEEIDIVVNTHLHSDHCGWNTSVGPAGDSDDIDSLIPTFPNAKYYVGAREWEDAIHPNERTRATYLERNLLPVADHLELLDGEVAITDEIRFLPTPGHTHGHGAVIVKSGQEWGVYVGDMVQHRSQLERTAWVSGLDVLPLVSMETKKDLMDRCIEEEALIMFCHGPYPGIGRMTRTEQGFRKWVDVEPDGQGLPHPHEA